MSWRAWVRGRGAGCRYLAVRSPPVPAAAHPRRTARQDAQFTWPAPSHRTRVTVGTRSATFPTWRVAGAQKAAPTAGQTYDGPKNAFQRRCATAMEGDDANRVHDHITRPVREDDKIAFELMDAKTRYSDLPEELRRYRADIFDDKYKRLDENGLSRTITAHIAKDGYWYIHPRDNRTLTVREAARLQTFPDRYRFAGPPSAAFRQIGNAVPPFLGEQLGLAIRDSLDEPRPAGPVKHRHGQRARAVVPRSAGLGRPVAAGIHPLAGHLGGDPPGTPRWPALRGSGRWSSAGRSPPTPLRLAASSRRSLGGSAVTAAPSASWRLPAA